MAADAGDELVKEEVSVYRIGNRTQSAALLAWFLETVWRVDPEEVADSICDARGDKGIDALIVDDDALEITIFQSKWREDPEKSTQGDNDLRQLVGASEYFRSTETVNGLIQAK